MCVSESLSPGRAGRHRAEGGKKPFPWSSEHTGKYHEYIHERENANLPRLFKRLMNTKCVSKSGFLESNLYRVTQTEACHWTSEYPNRKRRTALVQADYTASFPKALVRGQTIGKLKVHIGIQVSCDTAVRDSNLKSQSSHPSHQQAVHYVVTGPSPWMDNSGSTLSSYRVRAMISGRQVSLLCPECVILEPGKKCPEF